MKILPREYYDRNGFWTGVSLYIQSFSYNTDLVKKGVAGGITPVSQGVGDRPFPGGLLLFESLLRKLGTEDYGKLLDGKLSFKDPRVVEGADGQPRLFEGYRHRLAGAGLVVDHQN